MTWFEPSPAVLSYQLYQRFVFFELLALLSLLRIYLGPRFSRAIAAATLLVCIAAIASTFAPALNAQHLPGMSDLARLMVWRGGLGLPLVASAVFALSFLLPSRRWPWIDAFNLLLALGLVALWAASRV